MKQKELGKDAELAATELVRRAERAIGLAIRKGQERGEINAIGDGRKGLPDGETKRKTSEFFSGNKEMGDVYAMTDAMTDEQFDAVIDEAKAEGNLSRANVVRKVTGQAAKSKSSRPEVLKRTRRIDSHRVIAAPERPGCSGRLPS